jgi:hypothetical protein
MRHGGGGRSKNAQNCVTSFMDYPEPVSVSSSLFINFMDRSIRSGKMMVKFFSGSFNFSLSSLGITVPAA